MKQNNMKETILSAATDLIIKQGVKNTSLADIAKASNISKGTLYYHYSSKNDLICYCRHAFRSYNKGSTRLCSWHRN